MRVGRRSRPAAPADPADPVLVTTAPRNPQDEIRDRQRRYLWTMSIRVVLWIATVVLASAGVPWPIWAATLAGSLVLPWVAVVMANAGPRSVAEQPSLYSGRDRKPLPPGRS